MRARKVGRMNFLNLSLKFRLYSISGLITWLIGYKATQKMLDTLP